MQLAGSHGGNHVEVEGSFDNWTTRQPLQKSGKDFTIIKLLPPGVYQVRGCIRAHMNLYRECMHGASRASSNLSIYVTVITCSPAT